jgi:hypothetical protein
MTRSRSWSELVRRAIPAPDDFHRRFGVGRPDRIAPVDACGVMLASVQGLAGELDRLDREIRSLRREIRERGKS